MPYDLKVKPPKRGKKSVQAKNKRRPIPVPPKKSK